ncbi:hypothetical protein A3K63_02125 [Candidatus Micrarchaeota archaeon RBG_16_49_10]|nr:MAG: hypothetical protein A3K63_02125 [Candidatus Micrarchaeota archaeon RBG_16_49_10]
MLYIAYPSQMPKSFKRVLDESFPGEEKTTPKDREAIPKDKFVSKSLDLLKKSDYFVAEVSEPSTGVGIEIGWAYGNRKRMIFLAKKGAKVSRSIGNLPGKMIEYRDAKDLKAKLGKMDLWSLKAYKKA